MAEKDRSVREELDDALREGVKQIILKHVDQATLRKYLLEVTTEKLQEFLRGYKLEGAIEAAVAARVNQEIPKIVEEVISKPEFKEKIASAVGKAVEAGMERGAKVVGEKIYQAVGGRSY